MKSLHERFIIHRDIKLENILRHNTIDGVIIKIADLGFAKQLDSDTDYTFTNIGTPYTMV